MELEAELEAFGLLLDRLGCEPERHDLTRHNMLMDRFAYRLYFITAIVSRKYNYAAAPGHHLNTDCKREGLRFFSAASLYSSFD